MVSKNILSPGQTTFMIAYTPTEMKIGSKGNGLQGQMNVVVNTKL